MNEHRTINRTVISEKIGDRRVALVDKGDHYQIGDMTFPRNATAAAFDEYWRQSNKAWDEAKANFKEAMGK